MKAIDETAGGKKVRQPKPVTVTFTGELAAAIRSGAKDSRRTVQQIAENYCEYGCDRPDGGKRLFIDVPAHLEASFARLAEAASYSDGVVDLALETYIPDAQVIDAVARTLIRMHDLTADQMAAVTLVAMQEKLRHSKDHAEKWIAKRVYGMEVEE